MLEAKDEFFRGLTERNSHDISFSEKLKKSTVGIAGCGGLGSNVAMSLTRSGVGRLIIADFDNVVLSNLNRQFFFTNDIGKPKAEALKDNLKKINPYIEIISHTEKITPENLTGFFSSAEAIVEAFDDEKEKSMIINSFLDEKTFSEKYLLCASGLGGIASANLIKTIKYSKRIFVSGDFVSSVCGGYGVVSPRVLIAAAHQANMVIRLLTGEEEP
ncbi:MAG TPA: sulfur carrier protein ThiS adenylyltransferase ThiF [Lentisphaeria bacterium]|nr:MAG: thiamine biosynthesis protein ThiF [Lentisphaerae bacterium GWF2_38_69]HBM14928.1 sulfur carrier protein ThiS adenylyltransferase ThiF [Lentisphaeria bacterium]